MSLKEMRAKTGLSQKEFAERVGIPVRSYQNYEQGHRDIYKADINTLIRICHAADCSLTEFITDEECQQLFKELK
ncbi:MAG: helix-turn-helix transcriptional regulator [Anaerovoracaceae bacterium]